VRLLAANRWPFRLHATYDESISRFLDVFESVDKEIPFAGLRWFFDHAETVTERNLERIKALSGGIAIQHRMAYQGEYFINRYGAAAAQQTPPFKKMLQMGIPVGAGTDATRVASYNPWVSLFWMVAGKTIGGAALYPEANCLDRSEALLRYTQGSAWFSGEEEKKGRILAGQLADLSVLSADYFSVSADEIKSIESVLTIVDGKIVYGAGDFANLSPPPLPVLPDWSPVKEYGGYFARRSSQSLATTFRAPARSGTLCSRLSETVPRTPLGPERPFWGLGCECFAF
jgi:predicted amidohydrolase YtcJ